MSTNRVVIESMFSPAVSALNGQNIPDTYDLIFMDIQMPIMDGYTATRMLREQGLETLIICGLSANAMK